MLMNSIIVMIIVITIIYSNDFQVAAALVSGGALASGEDKYGDSATNLAR